MGWIGMYNTELAVRALGLDATEHCGPGVLVKALNDYRLMILTA